jgi:hypothetical protein
MKIENIDHNIFICLVYFIKKFKIFLKPQTNKKTHYFQLTSLL